MSKFFKEESSSSFESDSSSGSEESFTYDSEEEAKFLTDRQTRLPSKYVKGAGADSESDSGDEGKRGAKSQKQKMWDDIVSAVKAIRLALEDYQWQVIYNEFERMTKSHAKVARTLEKETRKYMFYIKALVELEDHITTTADAVKDGNVILNPLDTKAYNAMKQRLRKYNKTFEAAIESFRKAPVGLGEDEQEDEEEDDDFWGSSSSSESSSEVDLDPRRRGIARWLKKDKPEKETKEKKKTVSIAPVAGKQLKDVIMREGDEHSVISDSLDRTSSIGESASVSKEVIAKKLSTVTEQNFAQKIFEFVAERGKKKTDRSEQIQLLTGLKDLAKTAVHKVKATIAVISAHFDLSSSPSGYMNIETWKSCHSLVEEILDILETNEQISFGQFVVEHDPDDPSEENKKRENNVRGSLVAFLIRLDEEFLKSLKAVDCYSPEYVERLRDETHLYVLIARAQKYLEKTKDLLSVSMVIQQRLEHIYFKPVAVIRMIENCAAKYVDTRVDPSELVKRLSVHLYRQQNDKARIQAVLYLIYHHALHDRFSIAKEMMLSSHIQESISQQEIPVQILYNRTMAQLGLGAFRQGLIKDAHQALHELYSSGRQKELLGQGIQKHQEKTTDQERLEKARLLPFHMHINLDILESVYLTTSMLLEIPNMASESSSNGGGAGTSSSGNTQHRVISKSLRRFLDANERNAFSGPPENTRDYVIAASKALSQGEWKTCRTLISNMKVWSSGVFSSSFDVESMLSLKIREEALRTFLFKNSPFYTSLQINVLCELFEFDEAQVHSLVSRMILCGELYAAIDQNAGIISFHKNDFSKLENVCIQLSEKLTSIWEDEERMLDTLYRRTRHVDSSGGGAGGSGGRGGSSGANAGSSGPRRSQTAGYSGR